MIEKTKKLIMKDAEGKPRAYVTIRAFGALEGVNFIEAVLSKAYVSESYKDGDRTITRKQFFAKPVLEALLPFATVTDATGATLAALSLENIDDYFESPLEVAEVAMEVASFNLGFMKSSGKFQGLIQPLESLLTSALSASTPGSEA
jgi:hypothetical protein